MTDNANIVGISAILNGFLCAGISPPQTSESLMEIFEGLGSKAEIIQWFQEGRIKWVQGCSDSTPDDIYQANMNTAILKYLNR